MSKISGPRSDSSAYWALARLYALGGKATVPQLISCVRDGTRNRKRFGQQVEQPLLVHKFMTIKGDAVAITALGRKFVEACDKLAKAEAAVQVPVEVKPPKPALNLSKHFAGGPRRDGAMDYRDIPSLMGETRVPFRGETN